MHDNEHLLAIAAGAALPEFGLGSDAQLTPLTATHNCVFRVDHRGERFVLRLQSNKRLSDKARALQFAWLRAIRSETQLHVPDPVATMEGAWSIPAGHDGEGASRSWVLLRWVDGEPLRNPDSFVTPSILEKVGEAVARLHQHSGSFRPEEIGSARRIDADALVGQASCLADGSAQRIFSVGDYSALVVAASNVAAAMEYLWQLPGQTGLIHADLEPANWVFYEGEPRIIDFDEFGNGPFLFDLLEVVATHILWDEYASFRSALLSGYGRIRPLPSAVLGVADLIQAATMFAWLNHGCRLVDDDARSEFLKWVPATTAAISRLCRTDR